MTDAMRMHEEARAKRQGRDSALDTLIPEMSFEDARDHEKGPIFTPGALRLLVCAVVAVVSIALAIALA